MKMHRDGTLLVKPLGTCFKKDTETLCREEIHKALLTYKAYFILFFWKAVVSDSTITSYFIHL